MRPLPPLRRSLALRLAAAALLPIGAVSLLIFWYLTVRTVEAIRRENLLLAGTVRGRVEAFLGEPLASLQALEAILAVMRGAPPADIERHLDATVRSSPLLESVYITGGDGRVLAAGVEAEQTAARSDFIGIDLSHQPFLRQAVAAGAPAWSETFLSILSGRVSLALCLPHGDGALLGTFNIERLQQFVRDIQRGGHVSASIVDRDGSIIAHPDPEIALRQVKVSQFALVREAIAGREGSARIDLFGEDAIVSATPIAGTGWVVLVSRGVAEAYGPVRVAALGFGAAVLVSVAAALLFALSQARRVSGPLAALAEHARTVAGGGYGPTPRLGGSREVQELAESFGVMTDAVRERERLLRVEEEKYRLLVENAGDAVFVAQDGRLPFVNRHAEELTGRDAATLRGAAWTDLIHPDDRGLLLGRHRDRMAGAPVSPATVSFRILRPGGEERWVQMNSVLLPWEGRPATLNFVRDVTELRRLEAQALQAQKLEAVGTLAGGVAHDFNNLLQVIHGAVELALMPGRDAAANRRSLEQIQRAAERGADLTGQLLAFGRKAESRRVAVSLNAEIEQLSRMLESTIPKMVRVELDLAPGLAPVHADPGQVQQALMNLALNAVQAMPEGGVLRIATVSREVAAAEGEAAGLRPGRYAEIAIADSGLGIEERLRGRIFDPFFTTKAPGRGSGLGLAMVFGIVKSHEGQITFDSVPGSGTTFRILLPCRARAAGVLEASSGGPEGAPDGRGQRVLVVDDEEMVRGVATEILALRGYRVLTAPDGETALRHWREGKPGIDLVLLDAIMPGMGGVRCLKELLGLEPGARVVVMSGFVGESSEAELLEAGARGFVGKPFSAQVLLAAVAGALRGRA